MKAPRRFLLIGWLILTLTLVFPLPSSLEAQADNRAALIVRFDDETVVTRCIHFTEAQISGYEVLARSGLEVVADFSGMGAAICKIGNTGCPADNCFCDAPSNYWSYWHLSDEIWTYAQAGATHYQVGDGAVEGWSWGPAEPPPVVLFEEVCTPPTNTPTATSTATPMPTSSPTVQSPTNTPSPSVQFWVDADTVTAGTCTTVHWITQQMQAVRLNEQDVPATGIHSVCPCEREAHQLRVTYPNGHTETLSVTVSATGTCATTNATATATSTPARTVSSPTPQPTPSPQPTLKPTAQPTATPAISPTPSTTPTTVPTATPLPALTTAAPPSATATRTPLPTVMPIAAPRSRAPWLPGYAIFGAIAGGLLVGLFVFVRRRG
jgi:hypothetical protein